MDKLLEAIREWCRYNRKDITAEDFVHRFREIFKEETTEIWDKEAWWATDKNRLRCRILKEMVVQED